MGSKQPRKVKTGGLIWLWRGHFRAPRFTKNKQNTTFCCSANYCKLEDIKLTFECFVLHWGVIKQCMWAQTKLFTKGEFYHKAYCSSSFTPVLSITYSTFVIPTVKPDHVHSLNNLTIRYHTIYSANLSERKYFT